MNFLDELAWRGLRHQVTDEAVARAAFSGRTSAYIGFDPTGSSLHVGSLLPIFNLRRLQLAGHRPIALVGGGTGMVGDPSGKSQERNLLTEADLRANTEGIRQQLTGFLDFEGPSAATVVDNLDWLAGAGLLTFLRDVGKHFSVNAMVQRDSVRNRLERNEQGISFTEFSYMLLQAYDFSILYRDHGCQGQLGGSDQWGNIVSGIDLIRRNGQTDAAPFGVTSPLITSRAGTKFGKTEEGTVWLDPARTSPYAFFQFWINTDDAEVGPYLRYFTFLERAEIEALEQTHAQAPHQRLAQRRLAVELTRLVHGDQGLEQAERATRILFTGQVRGVDSGTLTEIFADVPSATLAEADLVATDWALRTWLVGEGLPFASNGDAKKALRAGSVRINGEVPGVELGDGFGRDQLIDGRLAVIKVGKKRYWLAQLG